MKKRGFSLVEIVVAFAIFLIAFIPILELTRNTTLTIAKSKKTGGGGSGDGSGSVAYAGNILVDFVRQAERVGYNFMDTTVIGTGNKTGSKTYDIIKVSQTIDKGCRVGQYYLSPKDKLTEDPYNSSRSKCFVQDSGVDYTGKKITIRATRGKVKNITTLGASDSPALISNPRKNPPFIYLEGILDGNEEGKKDSILSPFQEYI
ncbi:MAG: prepilin-type N-terminal cleavage/methylation domain-containing protein [Cetobacterium sp.]